LQRAKRKSQAERARFRPKLCPSRKSNRSPAPQLASKPATVALNAYSRQNSGFFFNLPRVSLFKPGILCRGRPPGASRKIFFTRIAFVVGVEGPKSVPREKSQMREIYSARFSSEKFNVPDSQKKWLPRGLPADAPLLVTTN